MTELEILEGLTGKEITRRFQSIREIGRKASTIKSDIAELTREYEQRKADLEKQLSVLRSTCGHPQEFLSYNPDPSGNNDSYYECRVCGKTL